MDSNQKPEASLDQEKVSKDKTMQHVGRLCFQMQTVLLSSAMANKRHHFTPILFCVLNDFESVFVKISPGNFDDEFTVPPLHPRLVLPLRDP